jgi:hypothetical protein
MPLLVASLVQTWPGGVSNGVMYQILGSKRPHAARAAGWSKPTLFELL